MPHPALAKEVKVLLLSPRAHEPRPDMDLRGVVAELLASLGAAPGCVVVHEAVASLLEVDRALRVHRPDAVFNACETLGGRSEDEPLVPMLLERRGFTGVTQRPAGVTQIVGARLA